MKNLHSITIKGTNNTYAVPILDIEDNQNVTIPEGGSTSNSGSGVSSEELEAHNTSSDAHADIRAEINELATAINGAIITVPVDGWVAQEDGTYLNTINVDGVTDDIVYDVSLYGDNITEEQSIAFSELVTSITTGNGQIIVAASESITVELQLLLRGKFDSINQGGGSVGDLDASQIVYDDSNVKDAIDELNDHTTSSTAHEDIRNSIGTLVTKDSDLQTQIDEIIKNFSNPNLLINGDFQIWQRGTSHEFDLSDLYLRYTADRWYCMPYGGTVSKASYYGGMTLNSTQNKNIMMYLTEAWDKEILLNRDLTFSFMFNGTIYSHTFKLTALSEALIITNNFEFMIADVTEQAVQSANNTLFVFNEIPNGTIYWVKLELGTISTPFVPRSYAEEMSECVRYFYNYITIDNIGMIGTGGSTIYLPLPFLSKMRTVATITHDITKITVYVDGTSNAHTVTNITANSSSEIFITLESAVTKTTRAAAFYWDNGSKLWLDAEIY